jgi:lysophospholipase L1-like esterase
MPLFGHSVSSGGRAAKRRRARAFLHKLLLTIASAVATLLVLEVAFRLVAPAPAPIERRAGYYVSTLPLTTGAQVEFGAPHLATGAPLALRPAAGERRVFVFGESSVEGGPWHRDHSPPAILQAALGAAGATDVTVVNMGRAAARASDVYYYLLAAARFQPDVVVFYLGANDWGTSGGETLFLVDRPVLHAVWRALAERSHLLWALRVLAPRGGRGDAPSGSVGETTRLCGDTCFRAWADLLVRTARTLTDAHVIVTTPVMSPLPYGALDSLGEGERALSLCWLESVAPGEPRWAACLDEWRRLTGVADSPAASTLARIWRDVAERNGVELLDFQAILRDECPTGLAPPCVVDHVHLSALGYERLGQVWAERVGALFGLPGVVLEGGREPRDYDEQIERIGLGFESSAPLYAVPLLQQALQRRGSEAAREALQRIRWASEPLGDSRTQGSW